jgi:hypothetical protein
MTDAAGDAINTELYNRYQLQDENQSMCPTQFDYSNCKDTKWIERLLNLQSSLIPRIFSAINAQNVNLEKENKKIKELQIQNQKLIRIDRDMSGVIEEKTLDDFLGTRSSGQQQQQQPQPQESKGFLSRWFGTGGAFDFDRLNTIPMQDRCPLYSQKLSFNKCRDVNEIVDFLLNDARISQYLMNYDATALIKNNELKMENETLKPLLPGLIKENGELVFRINNAHRIAGTQSPLKMNWRMSYGDEPRRPIEWTIDEHAGGGRKTKRSKQSKSRSNRSKQSKRLSKKMR